MATQKFELEAELRKDIGKGASRRLRHNNQVPAIIYGAGLEPKSLILNHNKVAVALAQEAFYSHILTLTIDKKSEKVILKSVQRHPAKPRIQHIDFLRIRADQKLKMNVPIHFIGEDKAPGLKDGGVFQHLMSDLEVSCLPADLPEFIKVDVSELKLDESIHLTQINLPKGVELVAFAHGVEGHDQAVISIHIPRIIEEVVEAPAPTEEAAAATAEGAAPVEAPAAGEEPKKE